LFWRQALCSAMAKMCVRELRAENPNVSVFYMAWVSLIAALIGCFLPMTWGATDSFRVPSHWAEWVLLTGIGKLLCYQAAVLWIMFQPLNLPIMLAGSS
jgi:hypothetical protein